MKQISGTILIILLGLITEAQIKPPVAETDYLATYFLQPNSINALANDYGDFGDSIIIVGISGVHLGSATFWDSTIYYTPPTNNGMHLADTIFYFVKDVTTGLYSEEGKVIVSLERVKSVFLDANNLSGQINAVGNHFRTLNYWNPFEPAGGLEAPKGSGLSTIYNSSLWIGGYDDQGHLHTACERYRTGKLPYSSHTGFDFWPGPTMDPEQYDGSYINKYNQIWKVTRQQVEYHQQHYNDPAYFMPGAIQNWPAHGDTSIGMNASLAPFVDMDGDGEYHPENGDYPPVKGDQTVFFIFNDDYALHSESFGRKMGVEVLGQSWAYDCPLDSAFFNSIFIRYDIINRSDTSYHEVYLGNYTNFVLGYPDDYLGCDTNLNMLYVYNMDDFDDTISQYYPSYKVHPPAQAVVFLNQNLDHFMTSAFPYPLSQDTAYYSDPVEAQTYYNYMQSVWRDSTHLTYGGSGHGGTNLSDHIFTGNPIDGSGWLFSQSGYDLGKMHAIGSSGPFDFDPGDTLSMILAYVFARDYNGDQLSSLALLKDYVAQIRWFYENDSTPCGLPWMGISVKESEKSDLKLFPNPVSVELNIDVPGNEGFYKIYNLSGKVVDDGVINSKTINVSDLQPGMYIIQIWDNQNMFQGKFIKLNYLKYHE
jgi:hypothetical protein